MAGSKAAKSRPRSGTAAPARTGSAARSSGNRGGGNRPANRSGQGQRPRAGAARQPVAAEAPPEVTGPPAWLRWTTLVLALIGLGVSTYLTVAHYSTAVTLACPNTGVVNCQKVTTSAESKVFGIPVALLGLIFYVFVVGIMTPWAWRARRREVALARLLGLVVGIGFVIYLIYAELFEIGNICLECTSIHVITFILFVLTVLSAAVWGLGSGDKLAARR
jgi:uncharacterized membrane protein